MYGQARILTSSSTCWPNHKASVWMTSECVFHRYQGSKMEAPPTKTQAICVTWFPKSRWVDVSAKLNPVVFSIRINPIFQQQGSRLDDQRCSAPHILQNLGTPTLQGKDLPASEPSDKAPRRSGSLNRVAQQQVRAPRESGRKSETPTKIMFACYYLLF